MIFNCTKSRMKELLWMDMTRISKQLLDGLKKKH